MFQLPFLNQISLKLRGLEQIQNHFIILKVLSYLMELESLRRLVHPRVGDPNKNSCMVRNVYRALRNQVPESWTKPPPPTYKIRWGEHCIVPQ